MGEGPEALDERDVKLMKLVYMVKFLKNPLFLENSYNIKAKQWLRALKQGRRSVTRRLERQSETSPASMISC